MSDVGGQYRTCPLYRESYGHDVHFAGWIQYIMYEVYDDAIPPEFLTEPAARADLFLGVHTPKIQ